MKAVCKDFLTAVFMGLILPTLLLTGAAIVWEQDGREPVARTEPWEPAEKRYPMLRRTGETVTEGDLDGYLVGVVLAEMPTDFEPEALKAQAVAARTYAGKAYRTGGKHGDGSVCTEASCCQAYIDPEDYLAQGGSQEGVEKVRRAVEETSGLVLTYGGELIEATYFSCSGGSTEDAVAVWGTVYPYLRSVRSPGEEDAPSFTHTVTVSPEAFAQKLGLETFGEPEDWISLSAYTAGGSVQTMTVCGDTFTGTELRSLLGLRSASFTVEVTPAGFEITTRGHGHRVGMSQYGAEAMAAAGNGFEEILAHYYPGTELTSLDAAEKPVSYILQNE